MTSYLDPTSAADLIASLGLSKLAAKPAAEQATLLLLASLDIDAAGPWQGSKCDDAQERAFPRSWAGSGQQAAGSEVPDDVLAAVALQADALCDTTRQTRLAKLRDGLASVSVGSLSESYSRQPAAGSGQWENLCERSRGLLAKYRLRSGRIL